MNPHATDNAEIDNTRRWMVVTLGASIATLAGCANADSNRLTLFVVEYHLAPGAANKSGLQAVTDTGAEIFGKATLSERNGGLSSFGGTVRFPEWVQVTWREGVKPGEYWTTGTVVGSYRVDVLNRIPAEVFALAKAEPNRAIKLQFRVKDNGVLLAWTVEEHRKGGYVDILHGGDFKRATLYNGNVIESGWEK
jgi:hypothetical protein